MTRPVLQRPWHCLPIIECGEPLKPIPSTLLCLEPHPYRALGAPYGDGVDPFRLREGVIIRLAFAQQILQRSNPEFRLAIFDAWRPLSVQAFMVDYAINQECFSKGLKRHASEDVFEVEKVIENVSRFWALPSLDPLAPPPHSTGAALDLTLADKNDSPIDMGGDIDAISKISWPNYYLEAAKLAPKSQANVWHLRRCLLAKVMQDAGFVQHPNEWWHFSYGDQLWAWSSNCIEAIYGACPDSEIKASTA